MSGKEKSEPKKVKKLAVKRTTVKDLDVQSKRSDGIRGGRSSSGASGGTGT